jgi:hypothetical protein
MRDNRVIIIASVLVIVITLALAIGGAWLLALHAQNASQHKWCTTLELLTQQRIPDPADAAANPSRENAYLFYIHLKELEREFGC